MLLYDVAGSKAFFIILIYIVILMLIMILQRLLPPKYWKPLLIVPICIAIVYAIFIFMIAMALRGFEGPSVPSLAAYQAAGKEDIPVKSVATTTDLAKSNKDFAAARPNLKLVGEDTFDGCSLSSTEQSGDFTTAVGKVCSSRLQTYYASDTKSVDLIVSIQNTMRQHMPARDASYIVSTPSGYKCDNGFFTNNTFGIYSLDVYTLDPDVIKDESSGCFDFNNIYTSTPSFTKEGMLAGAIGADEKYQELHSISSVDRKEQIDQARADGHKPYFQIAGIIRAV